MEAQLGSNNSIKPEDSNIFNNKKLTAIIVAIVVGIVLSCFFLGYVIFSRNVKTSETQYLDSKQYASSTDDALDDSLKGYICNYMLDENGNQVISDEMAEEVIASITTGVLNSLPEAMQSDEETTAYIRTMIAAAVTEEVQKNNDKVLNSDGYVVTTTVSKDLLYYIDNVIVPMLTAELQIDAGELDDLMESLESTSDKYVADTTHYNSVINNISNRLSKLEKITNGEDYSKELDALMADLKELENIIANYKSNSSNEITSIDDELETAKNLFMTYIAELNARTADLEKYTEEELTDIRAQMLKKLSEIQNLTSYELSELTNIINNLEVSNEVDLSELKKQLEESIANSDLKNTDAINSAVDGLNQVINNLEDTVKNLTASQLEELRKSLQSQIDANANLTEEQKKELSDAITNLDEETASDIDSVKDFLQDYVNKIVEDSNSTLQNAIDSLQGFGETELSELKESLLEQISNNASLSESQRKALQDMIEKLNDKTGTDIDSVKEYLQGQINSQNQNMTDAVDGLTSTLEDIYAQLDLVRTDLMKLTENQIDELKRSLQAQIDTNKALSDEERAVLQQSIDSLDANTVKNLDDAKKQLQQFIEASNIEQSEALESAVDGLNLTIEDIYAQLEQVETDLMKLTEDEIEELKRSLQAQIDTNKTLSDEERAALQQSIDSLDASTVKNLDDARKQLLQVIEDSNVNQSEALKSAVSGLNLSIDDVYAQINSNKAAADLQFDDIDGQITSLNNSLDTTNAEVSDLKKSVSDGKSSVADAITAQGITTAADASWNTFVANIKAVADGKYNTGYNAGVLATKKGNVTASYVLSGYTFTSAAGVNLTGTMPNRGKLDWNPSSNKSYTLPAGYYSGGTISTGNAYNSGYNTGYTAGKTAGGTGKYKVAFTSVYMGRDSLKNVNFGVTFSSPPTVVVGAKDRTTVMADVGDITTSGCTVGAPADSFATVYVMAYGN